MTLQKEYPHLLLGKYPRQFLCNLNFSAVKYIIYLYLAGILACLACTIIYVKDVLHKYCIVNDVLDKDCMLMV